MSYDIYLTQNSVEMYNCGSYTYNVSPMYKKAIEGGIHILDGMSGLEAIPILDKAVRDMVTNVVKYKAYNPRRGWGNYDGALKFLENILTGCHLYPEAHIDFSQKCPK